MNVVHVGVLNDVVEEHSIEMNLDHAGVLHDVVEE